VRTRSPEAETASCPAERLAALIEGQAELFGEIGQLTAEHRRALLAADEDTLHALATQAETLAARFRMLEGQRLRMGTEVEDAAGESVVGRARERLLGAVEEVVRDRSVTAALMRRGAQHTDALARAFGLALSGAYLPSGSPAAPHRAGARLSKEV
jgi:hypothetical protein